MEREREWERERRLVLYKSTCQSSPNTSAGHRHVTRSQEPGWFRHLAPGWFRHLPAHKVMSYRYPNAAKLNSSQAVALNCNISSSACRGCQDHLDGALELEQLGVQR